MKKEIKEELNIKDRAFITLLQGDWMATEAYKLLFSTNAAPSSLKVLAARKRASLNEYIATKTMQKVNCSDVESFENSELDKTSLIAKMTAIANTNNDPKIKLDAYAKIAVITGMKNEVVPEKEDETVRYYLPVTCSICNLYKEAKNKKELELNNK